MPFEGGLETLWPLPFVTSPLTGAISFSVARLHGFTFSDFRCCREWLHGGAAYLVAVGKTAEDVTYRSYFDETFVGGINWLNAPKRIWYFTVAKVWLTAQRKIGPPGILQDFSKKFRSCRLIIFTVRRSWKFHCIFCFTRFLSTPWYCNVKIKRAPAHSNNDPSKTSKSWHTLAASPSIQTAASKNIK